MSELMSDERLGNFRRDSAIQRLWNSDEIRELLAEIDRLRAWKAEAMVVSADWEATWQAAGRPGMLGRPKAEGVRKEIARLRAQITEGDDA